MPFITEELYQRLNYSCKHLTKFKSICTEPLNEDWINWFDYNLAQKVEKVMEIVSKIRSVRQEYRLKADDFEVILETSQNELKEFEKLFTCVGKFKSIRITERNQYDLDEEIWCEEINSTILKIKFDKQFFFSRMTILQNQIKQIENQILQKQENQDNLNNNKQVLSLDNRTTI